MVRLKNRFLLLEFITENNARLDEGLDGKILLGIIRDAIATVHGDYGLGTCQHSLKVMFLSPDAQLAIVRCDRETCDVVWSSLTLISNIRKRPCIVRCLHVGSIVPVMKEKALEHGQSIYSKRSQRCSTPHERTLIDSLRQAFESQVAAIE